MEDMESAQTWLPRRHKNSPNLQRTHSSSKQSSGFCSSEGSSHHQWMFLRASFKSWRTAKRSWNWWFLAFCVRQLTMPTGEFVNSNRRHRLSKRRTIEAGKNPIYIWIYDETQESEWIMCASYAMRNQFHGLANFWSDFHLSPSFSSSSVRQCVLWGIKSFVEIWSFRYIV